MMNKEGAIEGWGRVNAESAFDKATGVIERDGHLARSPIGLGAEIPVEFRDLQRDAIWVILFSKFFPMVMEVYLAVQSVEFVFDDKPEIASQARMIHQTITEGIRESHVGVFLDGINFVADEDSPRVPPLAGDDLSVAQCERRAAVCTSRVLTEQAVARRALHRECERSKRWPIGQKPDHGLSVGRDGAAEASHRRS